ncbi:MAG: quinone-dependent dihydroorotate dehydrogenase [Actinomycetales bacterium]|nr:quinone-dependent dihydroorotate dehydrogenase [Actinomycetales bacterium]
MGLYDLAFDHVITRVDAEYAHRVAFRSLQRLYAATQRNPRTARMRDRAVVGRLAPTHEALAVEVFGRRLSSPLGLAAGFDKNAEGIDALAALGFGFVEIGTVTAHAQPGNPTPRLFRLPDDRAIINRMGFNNDGADAVAARLARRSAGPHDERVVVGVNIGKTKAVANDAAIEDYLSSTRALAPFADYLVVNVSSPNTPGLRDLQAVEQLRPLLAAVGPAADEAAGHPVPLLVKIAPDLADDDVVDVAALARDLNLAGVVATNTTISRTGLRTSPALVQGVGAGGLSGPVLAARSLEVLALLRSHLAADAVIISVGGISTADDVTRRLELGATLVQAYTGFVYGGPLWVRRINAEVARQREATR